MSAEEVKFEPGWLQKQIDHSVRTIHSWSCEKRGYHDPMEIVYRGRKQHVAVCHRCDHMEIRSNEGGGE